MNEPISILVRNEGQRDGFVRMLLAAPFPYLAKVAEPKSPKTVQQIRYAHSLCDALEAFVQCAPGVAKRDAKAEFGVVIVCTSVITGQRSARLKSFADYTKTEMLAFIAQMEVHLDEKQIPYVRAKDG